VNKEKYIEIINMSDSSSGACISDQ